MTSLTTRQKLTDDPHLAYLIDESAEIARWSAEPDSTEELPRVTISVVIEAPLEYIEINLTQYKAVDG